MVRIADDIQPSMKDETKEKLEKEGERERERENGKIKTGILKIDRRSVRFL